jgi:hypothetical protein
MLLPDRLPETGRRVQHGCRMASGENSGIVFKPDAGYETGKKRIDIREINLS